MLQPTLGLLPDPKAPSVNVGFRLDAGSHEILAARAAGLQVSVHALAKSYVLQLLHSEQERIALHREIAALHELCLRHRNDFLFAVEALLASAGQVSPEDARTWIHDNLVKP